MAVLDARGPDGPALEVFGPDGRFTRRVGRIGSGPGEFRPFNRSGILAVSPTGVIELYDEGNSRIDRWQATGSAMTSMPVTIVPRGAPPMLFAGPGGSVYLRGVASHVEGSSLSEPAFYQFWPGSGKIDTVFAVGEQPDAAIRNPLNHGEMFAASDREAPLRDGRLLVSGSEKLQFMIVRPGGGPAQHYVYADEPRPVSSAERDDAIAIAKWNMAHVKGLPMPHIASTMPAVSSLDIDTDGRIWMRRGSEAPVVGRPASGSDPALRVREPGVYSAFSVDGHYLGTVRFPDVLFDILGGPPHLMSFTGSAAWGVMYSPDQTPYLVKWEFDLIP